MKIHCLTVENFRCFSSRTVEFSPQFNVLVGDNGSGKTALLEALAVAAGYFFLGIDACPSRGIRKDDVRKSSILSADIPTIEAHYPVRIVADGTVDGKHISWTRSLIGEGVSSSGNRTTIIRKIARNLQQQVRDGYAETLPLIAQYGTSRMWHQPPQRTETGSSGDVVRESTVAYVTTAPGSRRDGYARCLDAESNHSFLNRWLKTYEISVLQRKTSNSTLDGLKAAVAKCMDRWTKLTYDILLDELLAEDASGNQIPTRLLSDGQRNILYMVLDIAYRASTLNPHFNGDACGKTPGIVLIDELDLHLHPKWQRRVVDDLRTVFPQIQFIATTHAPAIVQSLRAGELIDLNNGDTGEYVGRSTEDILEDVMDIPLPQRSLRSQRMIEAAAEYYRVLNEVPNAPKSQLAKLKRQLDELMEPFAENEAYIAFLQLERIAAGLGDKLGV